MPNTQPTQPAQPHRTITDDIRALREGQPATALDKAREATAAMRAAGIAVERLTPIEKARRNPTSLRAAITAKCWDCVCGDVDPRPRERIAECASATCPLVPVRPYQKRGAA